MKEYILLNTWLNYLDMWPLAYLARKKGRRKDGRKEKGRGGKKERGIGAGAHEANFFPTCSFCCVSCDLKID